MNPIERKEECQQPADPERERNNLLLSENTGELVPRTKSTVLNRFRTIASTSLFAVSMIGRPLTTDGTARGRWRNSQGRENRPRQAEAVQAEHLLHSLVASLYEKKACRYRYRWLGV